MEATYLKILDIQLCETKKNYFYKNILFEEVLFKEAKEFSTGRQSKRLFWKSRQMTIRDRISNRIQTINSSEDLLYKSATVGGYCLGKIVELKTTPYIISKVKNSTFLCVIFESEYSNILKEAARQLNFYKGFPLDKDGKPYRYLKNFEEVQDESNIGSDNELEYMKDEYEEELFEFLTGGDYNYDEFNGDWDELYASKGLE